ncbi:uncharacterized protein C3orf14 [Aplysia californica]|uniref:Uncharacterized protein C3orf14 n=1 Tax=Aplysia californica TaxID=6500 RepID=A0ABM0K6X2_APLCA|nr:uncharacterized protein C3orf14 [Aplysia californica]XP_005110154.1 uncharacterized protein C3orf14 [Aplysia californica]
MNKMKVKEGEATSAYHAKLEKWTAKEMQLNVLHEEIINKREAMLRTSRNLLTAQEDMPVNSTEAAIRNDRLLKDFADQDEQLTEELTELPSPRFANLQSNYWSMVTNMFPIWEKSLEESSSSRDVRTGAQSSSRLSATAKLSGV